MSNSTPNPTPKPNANPFPNANPKSNSNYQNEKRKYTYIRTQFMFSSGGTLRIN